MTESTKVEAPVRLKRVGCFVIAAFLAAAAASWAAGADALDPSFGNKGKVTTKLEAPFVSVGADAAALQPDGRIVTAGFAASETTFQTAVARYLRDGSLDPSFAGDGIALLDVGEFEVHEVAIQPSGRIVIAGTRGDVLAGITVVLAALNPDGTIDTAFAPDGLKTLELGGSTFPASLRVLEDGSMMIGGLMFPASGPQGPLVAARLTPDGDLDPAFGEGGKAVVDFDAFTDGGYLAVDENGAIVVSGNLIKKKKGDFVSLPALARLTPSGQLDESFSGDGVSRPQVDGLVSGLNDDAVAIQKSGRIVVLATKDGKAGADLALVGFRRDGRLDRSFGRAGVASTDFGGYKGGAFDEGTDIEVDGKDRIAVSAAVAETGSIEGSSFGVARFKPGGRLDRGFSEDGRQRTGFGGTDYPSELLVQGDGRIVLVGDSSAGSLLDDIRERRIALARYKAN